MLEDISRTTVARVIVLRTYRLLRSNYTPEEAIRMVRQIADISLDAEVLGDKNEAHIALTSFYAGRYLKKIQEHKRTSAYWRFGMLQAWGKPGMLATYRLAPEDQIQP